MGVTPNTDRDCELTSLVDTANRGQFVPRLLAGYVLCGIALLFDWAAAGEYKLTKGDGLPVCEAYRRNFEPRHDKEPMACERHYDPKIPGFKTVPWKKLDLKTHFQLYREAEVELATHVYGGRGMAMSEKEAQEMAKDLDGKARHLQVELYVARLPLFLGLHAVNVLSVRELGCGRDPKPDVKISRLFVLNGSMTHIDRQKQELLEGGGNNNATIELFEGEPYVEAYVADDNWSTLFTGSGALSVAQYTDSGFFEVCSIAFAPAAADSKEEVK
jgi:hypothetical protein